MSRPPLVAQRRPTPDPALSILRRVTDLAALRKSYELAELDESASRADPLQQFAGWLEQAIAAQLPEPNAMTLATVGADGRPSTRIVLLKGFDERGLVWYTNYQSRKGRELAAHPVAALQFHWVELERVVRIEGTVGQVRRAADECVLRHAPARLAHRRLGVAAKPGHRIARNPGRQCGALRRAVHAEAAASAALGRLSPASRRPGSSGKAASRACTTACATGSTTGRGCASATLAVASPRKRRAALERLALPSSRDRPLEPTCAEMRRPLGPAHRRKHLPESGYSTISGRVCVLMERYFSGASEVLMI